MSSKISPSYLVNIQEINSTGKRNLGSMASEWVVLHKNLSTFFYVLMTFWVTAYYRIGPNSCKRPTMVFIDLALFWMISFWSREKTANYPEIHVPLISMIDCIVLYCMKWHSWSGRVVILDKTIIQDLFSCCWLNLCWGYCTY